MRPGRQLATSVTWTARALVRALARSGRRAGCGFALALAVAVLACAPPVSLEGRPCPCLSAQGFACCQSSGLCVSSAEAMGEGCRPPATPPGPAVPGPQQGPTATDAGAVADTPATSSPPADAATEAPAAEPPPPGRCRNGGGEVRVLYYDNENQTGTMVEKRAPGLIFDWGENPPDPRLERDSWSALVTARLEPEVTGEYTFFVRADDGFRLWIDGRQLLDFWFLRGDGQSIAVSAPLQGGRSYEVVLEYFDDLGPASLELTWKPPGGTRTAIPQCALRPGSSPPWPQCPVPEQPCSPPGGPRCEKEDEGMGLQARFYAAPGFSNLLHTEPEHPIVLSPFWLDHPALAGRIFNLRIEGLLRAPLSETFTFFLFADANADATLYLDGRRLQTTRDPSGVLRAATMDIPLVRHREYAIRVDYVTRATTAPTHAALDLSWQSRSILQDRLGLCYLSAADITGLPGVPPP